MGNASLCRFRGDAVSVTTEDYFLLNGEMVAGQKSWGSVTVYDLNEAK